MQKLGRNKLIRGCCYIGSELPEGMVVTGYPVETLQTSVHTAFRVRYKKAFGKEPTYVSVHGYVGYKMIAAALQAAVSTDPQKVAAAL